MSPIEGQNINFDFGGPRPDNVFFWDISDPLNVNALDINESGFCNVGNQNETPKRFIIFNKNEASQIINIYLKENQNFDQLRNNEIQADYIIIGPEKFRDATSDLVEIEWSIMGA